MHSLLRKSCLPDLTHYLFLPDLTDFNEFKECRSNQVENFTLVRLQTTLQAIMTLRRKHCAKELYNNNVKAFNSKQINVKVPLRFLEDILNEKIISLCEDKEQTLLQLPEVHF